MSLLAVGAFVLTFVPALYAGWRFKRDDAQASKPYDVTESRIASLKADFVAGRVELDEYEKGVAFFLAHPGPLPPASLCNVPHILRLFYAPKPQRISDEPGAVWEIDSRQWIRKETTR